MSEIVPLTDFAMYKKRARAAGVRGVVGDAKVCSSLETLDLS